MKVVLLAAATLFCASAVYEQKCTLRDNYQFEGGACHLWGDPHFTTFAGAKHHYQGKHGKAYYYVARCPNKYSTHQPFQLAGTHYVWGNGPAQGLDYFTLELYQDDRKDADYIYISTEIAASAKENQGANLNYAASKGKTTALKKGANTFGRFVVTYQVDVPRQKVHLFLRVDDQNTDALKIEMHGQYNKKDNKWVMHAVNIDVGQQYKCSACGLCGDFQLKGSQLMRCDGKGHQQFVDAMDSPRSYEPEGWSYEADYYKKNCLKEDPCENRCKISKSCQKELEKGDIKQCCNKIGWDECESMAEDCERDLCLDDKLDNADKDTVKAFAQRYLDDMIMEEDQCERKQQMAAHAELENVFQPDGDDFEEPQYDFKEFEPEYVAPVEDEPWTLEITGSDLIIVGLVLVNIVVLGMSVKMCLAKKEKKVRYGIVDAVSTDDEI